MEGGKDVPLSELRTKTSFRHQGISQPKDSRNLLSKVRYVTRLSGGKILSFKYHDQTKQLKFIEVEIPTRNYGSFCQELAHIVTLRSSPPPLYGKEKKTIRVRMNIIPPD